MTFGAMALRAGGIAYNAYLGKTLGSAGMGFAGLVMTVFSLALTFSSAGLSLAVTRLVSEERHPLHAVMKHGCLYGLCTSLPLALLLFGFAPIIASRWLNEPAATVSLRILAPLLPVISLSSVFRGYFLAVRGIMRHTGILLFEMFVRVQITVLLLSSMPPKTTEESCVFLVLGTTAGELCAFILSLLLYRPKNKQKRSEKTKGVISDIARIALPDAAGASVRATLSATEHLLIPIGLEKHGLSHNSSLAFYGTLHSLALPVVLFPSALLRSISSLMVPELASQNHQEQQKTVSRVLRISTLYAVFCAGVLYLFADLLSQNLYGNDASTRLIRAFSLLLPVMFADTAVDGMLKGLDAQLYVMKINILDSLVSVFAVWFFLPLGGGAAYITIIMGCEILNFLLSVIKLKKLCSFTFCHLPTLLLPMLFTLLSAAAGKSICRYFPNMIGTISGICLSAVFYVGFLFFAGILPHRTKSKHRGYSVNKSRRLSSPKE